MGKLVNVKIASLGTRQIGKILVMILIFLSAVLFPHPQIVTSKCVDMGKLVNVKIASLGTRQIGKILVMILIKNPHSHWTTGLNISLHVLLCVHTFLL